MLRIYGQHQFGDQRHEREILNTHNEFRLRALMDAYAVAIADPEFHKQMAWYRREYIGGPTPLHRARRFDGSNRRRPGIVMASMRFCSWQANI